ncbi:hypothetical protein LY474_32400 [Myxococcus stipitatus]|uniref:hypothetical protein n=1 Tax=Myxococcus stipitatus TaxID=83455 RepID=UPI001F21BD0E|nr:hypothetical protein [Myxococcus stipitatus]MCE9672519.1 hypothetical protein [Myxococcus stipitatus]
MTNSDVNARRGYILGNLSLGAGVLITVYCRGVAVLFATLLVLLLLPLLLATIACSLDGLGSDYATFAARGLRRAIATVIVIPAGLYLTQGFIQEPTARCEHGVAVTRRAR